MGQYHVLVNLDKKEYLHPHRMGSGLKLGEWNQSMMMVALSVLLADNNGAGGGDIFKEETGPGGYRLPADHSGRWAGDRIVITGDYTDPETYKEERKGCNLYGSLDDDEEHGKSEFKDISSLMRESLMRTPWYRADMEKAKEW